MDKAANSAAGRRPGNVTQARDLAEELAVDRHYQPSDLDFLRPELPPERIALVQELVTELRSNPFLTDEVLDFYGQKLWRLLADK
jgi:hypothetical protein